MTLFAINNEEGFAVSDMELQREGVSYTYDTIQKIKEEYGDWDLYFIIGGDTVEQLPSWYKINELLKMVYSPESTIVRLSQDESELRVDYSQAITIFELVLPIHEELRKIVQAHMAASRKDEKMDEPSFDGVIEAEEYFYRGLVNMLMLEEFDHQFAEYNKARSEAKGAITAQSNFIQNDINRIVKLFHFSRDVASARSNEYYEVIDPLFALIEMTGGRRELPQGKNFGDMFISVKTVTREKTQKWELAWKPIYEQFMKHFTEEVAKLQQGAQA